MVCPTVFLDVFGKNCLCLFGEYIVTPSEKIGWSGGKKPSIILSLACNVCDFPTDILHLPKFKAKSELFCIQLFRRGIIGFIGSVGAGRFTPLFSLDENLNVLYLENGTIGEALKRAKNVNLDNYEVEILYGDPTINP